MAQDVTKTKVQTARVIQFLLLLTLICAGLSVLVQIIVERLLYGMILSTFLLIIIHSTIGLLF